MAGHKKKPLHANHSVGDVAYFQPVIAKIDAITHQAVDDSSIPVRIVGIKFDAAKVLYDIALPNGSGAYYEDYPLKEVDSYFMVKPPQE